MQATGWRRAGRGHDPSINSSCIHQHLHWLFVGAELDLKHIGIIMSILVNPCAIWSGRLIGMNNGKLIRSFHPSQSRGEAWARRRLWLVGKGHAVRVEGGRGCGHRRKDKDSAEHLHRESKAILSLCFERHSIAPEEHGKERRRRKQGRWG